MSRKEVMQLIFIIKAGYPKFFQKTTKEEVDYMLEVWAMVMEDYDYKIACAGIKAFMSTDTEGFPPSPGQIIDHIHKLTEKPENKLSEGEVWEMVLKAIQNGIYGAEDEFDALPPIVQRAVGSADVIRAWAMEENVNVTQSNFLRSYRAVSTQAKEEAKIPQSVKAEIGMQNHLQITESED